MRVREAVSGCVVYRCVGRDGVVSVSGRVRLALVLGWDCRVPVCVHACRA